MSPVGETELRTRRRVVEFFQDALGYEVLGDWKERHGNRNVEEGLLRQWLSSRRVENEVIERALFNFRKAAATGGSKPLYDANREVYGRLRYRVKVPPAPGAQTETVWLVDWANPEKNHFVIAEEVTVLGREHQGIAARPGKSLRAPVLESEVRYSGQVLLVRAHQGAVESDRVSGDGDIEVLDSASLSFEVDLEDAECAAHFIGPLGPHHPVEKQVEALCQDLEPLRLLHAGQPVSNFCDDGLRQQAHRAADASGGGRTPPDHPSWPTTACSCREGISQGGRPLPGPVRHDRPEHLIDESWLRVSARAASSISTKSAPHSVSVARLRSRARTM